MKIRVFYILLFIISNHTVHAVDSLYLKRSIAVHSKNFTTDPLGNIYVVRDNNSLIKYNSGGDSTGFFNEIKKGKIKQIDATNPLRILVYLSDFGTVLVLDNLLSLKSTLYLNQLGLINVPCVANSADGNIWVYDPSGVLLKVNQKPEVVFTTNLRTVLPEAIEPVFMVEQDRTLFLVDSTEGIRKFDQYGLYKSAFPFKTSQVQFLNQYLVYFKHPELISYNTLTFSERKLSIPYPDDILNVRIEREQVLVLRKGSLDIYGLETTQP